MIQSGTTHAVVTGGAGFIGSHLVDRLMKAGHFVTVIDNLSGGQEEFIAHHMNSKNFTFVKADIREQDILRKTLHPNTDIVFHLAANADIAKGVEDPSLDFEHSIVATYSVLEAMRHSGIKKIAYTSGSGVYGDRGTTYSLESTGPLTPVSMYGAAKLSAEALISAYTHLFGMKAWILRPANIIGPRITHGVVFDFVQRLTNNPTTLHILGDGCQSKSYLHVDDVIDAMLLVLKKTADPVNIYNVSSRSYVTVNEIADLVMRAMRLNNVKVTYSGGTVGWKGDVAIVRLRSTRLRQLGWKPAYSSRQAVQQTIASLLNDARIQQTTQHTHAHSGR